MSTLTIINLEKWLVPQLQEILQMKMNKGDIQAEFELKDTPHNKSIKVNLKQLFIIIQALLRVPGNIGLEEIEYNKGEKLEIPGYDRIITRELYITRDGSRIKDISTMGASQSDVAIRDQARLIEHNWNKE